MKQKTNKSHVWLLKSVNLKRIKAVRLDFFSENMMKTKFWDKLKNFWARMRKLRKSPRICKKVCITRKREKTNLFSSYRFFNSKNYLYTNYLKRTSKTWKQTDFLTVPKISLALFLTIMSLKAKHSYARTSQALVLALLQSLNKLSRAESWNRELIFLSCQMQVMNQ